MNDGLKIFSTVIFFLLAVLMAIRFLKTRGKIKVKDQQPKMMFYLVDILVTLLVLSTIFTYKTNTWLDYVRLAFTVLVIVLFYNVHDGVGDDGVSIQGTNYIWEDIKGWDYASSDKGTTLYFEMHGQKMDKNGKVAPKMINFTKENGEEALKMIKEHVQKKYKRMRK